MLGLGDEGVEKGPMVGSQGAFAYAQEGRLVREPGMLGIAG